MLPNPGQGSDSSIDEHVGIKGEALSLDTFEMPRPNPSLRDTPSYMESCGAVWPMHCHQHESFICLNFDRRDQTLTDQGVQHLASCRVTRPLSCLGQPS
jgi:hypothetical protein